MKSYRASLISVNSDHDQCRKKKVFVKSVSTKKQANMDHITGDNIPRSFVFSRCKLPGPLKQLQVDLRKLMLPYTALKLKVCKYLNVSGEWDGHGADFTREGCPIELPENVTQCPTLANLDEHTLLYKNIELLPAVGCEADAVTR
ncbi:unnamed protein product [Malus baccata var. baccata]